MKYGTAGKEEEEEEKEEGKESRGREVIVRLPTNQSVRERGSVCLMVRYSKRFIAIIILKDA